MDTIGEIVRKLNRVFFCLLPSRDILWLYFNNAFESLFLSSLLKVLCVDDMCWLLSWCVGLKWII